MGKYKKFNVYITKKGDGCYSDESWFAGQTWAVSAKQACNNVRFRGRSKRNPHGGYSYHIVGDYLEEGVAVYSFRAEEA